MKKEKFIAKNSFKSKRKVKYSERKLSVNCKRCWQFVSRFQLSKTKSWIWTRQLRCSETKCISGIKAIRSLNPATRMQKPATSKNSEKNRYKWDPNTNNNWVRRRWSYLEEITNHKANHQRNFTQVRTPVCLQVVVLLLVKDTPRTCRCSITRINNSMRRTNALGSITRIQALPRRRWWWILTTLHEILRLIQGLATCLSLQTLECNYSWKLAKSKKAEEKEKATSMRLRKTKVLVVRATTSRISQSFTV